MTNCVAASAITLGTLAGAGYATAEPGLALEPATDAVPEAQPIDGVSSGSARLLTSLSARLSCDIGPPMCP
ncbi:hypothetical protein F5X71_03680 [Nocardia brasiliensis]|uniref:Uncharacterized protein n=1 Tax=Nocardia brasiliensis TaxID=37326 RepID=A0A6G9XKS3_NOCBR|nr:hypothetical protein [Nocardia brasiliensis]QIS01532.1 hypothetical protein F5X71_03680 [Nocardia brasiliensis]